MSLNKICRSVFFSVALSFFVLALGFLGANEAQAFPELIRHGYVNCTSCHYNPNGGGILTDYGRALSKEVLSSGKFFFEKSKPAKPSEPAPDDESGVDPEAQFLYGSVALPSWLRLGGDIRTIQIFQDTPKQSSGRFIWMQADLEMMAEYKRVRFVGTIGRDEPRARNPQFRDYVISRRHWISGLLGPEDAKDQWQVRFGRFYPAYGIYNPEHVLTNRINNGFDQGWESYNGEVAYIGEKLNVFLTGILGRPDNSSLNREQGAAVQVGVPVASTYKVGANFLTGRNETSPGSNIDSSRDLVGVWGLLGFTHQWYSHVQVDRVHRKTAGQSHDWGWNEYTRLGYEAWQGVHFQAIQEFYDPSRFPEGNQTHYEAYRVGMQYFPRPHWDFQGLFGKERNTGIQKAFNTAIWLNFHYYL